MPQGIIIPWAFVLVQDRRDQNPHHFASNPMSSVAMKGNILSEFIDHANIYAAATASYVSISGVNSSTDVSNLVSTALTTITNTILLTLNPPRPTPPSSIPTFPALTIKLLWDSRGYAANTSDEADSTVAFRSNARPRATED
ncbi:MAG: hypothetical protein Q9221_003099 [Calogaya cf. arnoldii]